MPHSCGFFYLCHQVLVKVRRNSPFKINSYDEMAQHNNWKMVLTLLAFLFLLAGCSNGSKIEWRTKDFGPLTFEYPKDWVMPDNPDEILYVADNGKRGRAQDHLERGISSNYILLHLEDQMNEFLLGDKLELHLFDSLKSELTSYCYRMLGSIDDADDAVQETFIRVWENWYSFRQESSYKTWVYRIASNICLDKLRQAKRRTRPVDFSDPATSIIAPSETLPDSTWVWPTPDFSENPEDIVIRKDTLQLCFITLLQTLPPRQRAVLLLKDVIEWSSKQIAATLRISPVAVNSALQRARETMNRLKHRSEEYSLMDLEPDQELLSRYVEAFEQFDIHALVALFHEEGHMSMPPYPMWYAARTICPLFSHICAGNAMDHGYCRLR